MVNVKNKVSYLNSGANQRNGKGVVKVVKLIEKEKELHARRHTKLQIYGKK